MEHVAGVLELLVVKFIALAFEVIHQFGVPFALITSYAKLLILRNSLNKINCVLYAHVAVVLFS